MIKDMILQADDYCLLLSTDDRKENLRAAYQLALVRDELPADFKESADMMIIRTGAFIYSLVAVLDLIGDEFNRRVGLTGGAAGNAPLGDAKHLSREEALELANITLAQREAEIFKRNLLAELKSWVKPKESAK